MGTGLDGLFGRREGLPLGVLRVGGVLVPLPGRVQPPLCRVALHGELFGAGRRFLRGVDVGLQCGAGGLPVGEPALRLVQDVLVDAFLPVEPGPLTDQLGEAPFGPAGRVEPAQFLGGPAGGGGEPRRTGVREVLGQRGTRAFLRGRGPPVFGVGGVPQLQCGGHAFGLAGALHAGLRGAVGVGPLRQPRRPLPCLAEPALQPVQFPCGGQVAFGGGLGGLGGGEPAVGDGQQLAGGAAGDGGGGEDGFGESRLARRQLRRFHGVAGGLLHPVGVGQQRGVPLAHPRLRGAAPLGEAFLDLGEAPGVEEPAEELTARLRVGAQEAREVALGQQHDLAELLAAHAEQVRDLLADLLVGAAEVLPGPGTRVVLAQPGLGLVDGRALAAQLRALPGRLPGDLQPPSGDGEFEAHLGARADGGVVAAQGHALAALAGAGHRAVQGVADGVEDGGLAGAGGAVQQEESGGRQVVEVDALRSAEGPEGGDVQLVQPHRATSRTVSSARTASKASRSTSCSWPSGPAPRTCVTKSSAICWSLRPARRRA